MSNVNRRAFLASAAVATAAASRLSAADGDRLRVGFVGVGGRGTALLRNFLEAKLGDVVAVCDIKPEHAKRAATLITGAGQKEPTLIDDWKKLLEEKDVQAVVSALPCDLHAACYLDVIAAGKDLYGEKPMCLTPAGLRQGGEGREREQADRADRVPAPGRPAVHRADEADPRRRTRRPGRGPHPVVERLGAAGRLVRQAGPQRRLDGGAGRATTGT